MIDERHSISQGPFLDRTGLACEVDEVELDRETGSNLPNSAADSSLKLREGLLLEVCQRSSGVRLDSNSREETRERSERGPQDRVANEGRKRVHELAVLKRPRRKWRNGEVWRKMINDVASSVVKRIMKLIKDDLLSFSKGNVIGDGVHADSSEEICDRSKDASERRSIVERLNVDDFVPPNV